MSKSTNFTAASRTFTGHLSFEAPIERVFPLFSPLGERAWVPGWNPELLHPSEMIWGQGQIFRTREDEREAIWIVTALNHESHDVEYHRVEPGRYVARVRVTCTAAGDETTEVTTEYAFVGLSDEGNSEIEGMTVGGYLEKMQRWDHWIGEYFTRTR